MWPEDLMPDPRGGRRLLPFDCAVKYKKTTMKIPIKITDPSDYIPGTKKARITEKKIWLVEITMPKKLMFEIERGSLELESESVEAEDIESAYETGADNLEGQDQMAGGAAAPAPAPAGTPAPAPAPAA